MRYFALFLMLLSLCVFSVGCGETAPDPAPTPPVDAEDDVDVDEEEVDVDEEAPIDEPAEPEFE